MLSNAQRATQLGVSISQLSTPFKLSPAAPKATAAHLELYSACLFPQSPGATGSALLNSTLQPQLSSIASISFRRPKKGQKYLVEFHVQLLNPNATYRFEMNSQPPQLTQDLSLAGGQALPIVVLIEPADEFKDPVDIVAEMVQMNDPVDAAAWMLYSVHVSTAE